MGALLFLTLIAGAGAAILGALLLGLVAPGVAAIVAGVRSTCPTLESRP